MGKFNKKKLPLHIMEHFEAESMELVSEDRSFILYAVTNHPLNQKL
jgi:hypothetical protein